MPQSSEAVGLLNAFNPGAIPYALLWILGSIVAMRIIRRVMTSLSERVVKYRLTIKQLNTLISFVVYAAAFAFSLSSLFNFSSELLFALSGTLAVTVGFAMKDVAASFMAGITILINKPFQVGDRISFGGYYGEVKEIGLRTVRLVTLDDNLVSIPSNKFLTEAVASANAGQLECMVVMSFFVSADADHRRAKSIVEDAILASKYLYMGKTFTVLVASRIVEHGVLIVELVAKAYVFDTRYEKAFASDVTDRVLSAFREHEIQLPSIVGGQATS